MQRIRTKKAIYTTHTREMKKEASCLANKIKIDFLQNTENHFLSNQTKHNIKPPSQVRISIN